MPPRNRGRAAKLRGTHVVRTAVKNYTDAWYRSEPKAPCWLCGQDIDPTVTEVDDDNHFEADHLYPVADYPEHAADPANLRPSHRGCNRRRSNSMVSTGLGVQSRDWESLAG